MAGGRAVVDPWVGVEQLSLAESIRWSFCKGQVKTQSGWSSIHYMKIV